MDENKPSPDSPPKRRCKRLGVEHKSGRILKSINSLYSAYCSSKGPTSLQINCSITTTMIRQIMSHGGHHEDEGEEDL